MQANHFISLSPADSLAALTDQLNLTTLQAIQEGEAGEVHALSQIEEIARLAFSCYLHLSEDDFNQNHADEKDLSARVTNLSGSSSSSSPSSPVNPPPFESDLFQRFVQGFKAQKEVELQDDVPTLTIKTIQGTQSCQLELCLQGKKAQLIASNNRLTTLTPSTIIDDQHLRQILLALPEALLGEITFISFEILQHLSLVSLPTLLELCPKSLENTARFIRQLPAFHDWIVSLSDGQVGITSSVIALKSPYFASLFHSEMINYATKTINLAQDTNVGNFQLYLDFVYDQTQFLQAEINLEVFLELLKVAHYFNDEATENKIIYALRCQLLAAAEGSLSYEEILSLIAFKLSIQELEGIILQSPMVHWLLEPIEKNIDIFIGNAFLSFSPQSTKEEQKLFKKQLKEINHASTITSLGAHWLEPKKVYDYQLELLSPLTQLETLNLTQAQFLKTHLVEIANPSVKHSNRFIDSLGRALPHLKELKFKNCILRLEAFQDFYRLQEMTALEFEHCSFVSACRQDCNPLEDVERTSWVSYLQFLPKLKKLSLLPAIESSEHSLLEIRGLTLQRTDLTWLPKSQVEDLSAALISMTTIGVINPFISPQPILLKKLRLDLNYVLDNGLMTSLKNMPQLQNLHLHFRGTIQIFPSTAKVTSLAVSSLKLSFADPTSYSPQSILKLIDCFPQIETLEMQDNLPQLQLMLEPLLARLNARQNFKQLIVHKDLHSYINKNEIGDKYHNIEFVTYLNESDLSV
ncbi:MAG: hypothetical protein K0S07_1388 [Chlamydiales bacterium]|nr:hypothetical protein [Chlamydiales bacterium]